MRLGPEDGLRRQSVVNFDDIITVRRTTLAKRITELSTSKMAEVDLAIKFASPSGNFMQKGRAFLPGLRRSVPYC
ncbi:MAG TPA: type II toxin-antitoxin system PemK/MazF family toxin [Dehalococcoidia bacterium]|nr:type II toxin-antitoxin system PemK/MazF family toxin [Dehalococcoidia bacterium]